MLKRCIYILLHTVLVHSSNLYSTEFHTIIEYLGNWRNSNNFISKQEYFICNTYFCYNKFIDSTMFNYLFSTYSKEKSMYPMQIELRKIPERIKYCLKKQEEYERKISNSEANSAVNFNKFTTKNTNNIINNTKYKNINNNKINYINKYSNKFDIKTNYNSEYNNKFNNRKYINKQLYYDNNDMLCNLLKNQINDLQYTNIQRKKKQLNKNTKKIAKSKEVVKNNVSCSNKIVDNNNTDVDKLNNIINEKNETKPNSANTKNEDIKYNSNVVNISDNKTITEINENKTSINEEVTNTNKEDYIKEETSITNNKDNISEKTTDIQENNKNENSEILDNIENTNNDNNNKTTEEFNTNDKNNDNYDNTNSNDIEKNDIEKNNNREDKYNSNNLVVKQQEETNIKKFAAKEKKAKQLEAKRQRKRRKKNVNRDKDTVSQNKDIEQNNTDNNKKLIQEKNIENNNEQAKIDNNELIEKDNNIQEESKENKLLNKEEEKNNIIDETSLNNIQDSKLNEIIDNGIQENMSNITNTSKIKEYDKLEDDNKKNEEQQVNKKKKKKNKTRYKIIKEVEKLNNIDEEEKQKKPQIIEFNQNTLQNIDTELLDFNVYTNKIEYKNRNVKKNNYINELYQNITRHFDELLCIFMNYFDSNLYNKSFEEFTDEDKSIISLSHTISKLQIFNRNQYNNDTKSNILFINVLMNAKIESCTNCIDVVKWIRKNTTKEGRNNIDLKLFVKFMIYGVHNTLGDRMSVYQRKVYEKLYNYFKPILKHINENKVIFESLKKQNKKNNKMLNNDDREYLIKEYSKNLLPLLISLLNGNKPIQYQYRKFLLNIIMDIKSYKTSYEVSKAIYDKTTDIMLQFCNHADWINYTKNIKLKDISSQEVNKFYDSIKNEQNKQIIELKIWDFIYNSQYT